MAKNKINDSKPEIVDDKALLLSDVTRLINKKHAAAGDVTLLPWDVLRSNRQFNVRDEYNYNDAELLNKRLDIQVNGLQNPLAVSMEPAYDRADGNDYALILVGNLRYTCMSLDRMEFDLLVKDGKADPADRPWETVPCIVHRGLTLEQETVILLDHGQQKDLSDREMFRAVERLFNMNWTETQIAVRLGGSKERRGIVSKHFRALKLPKNMTKAYRDYLNDIPNAPKMTADVVNKLFKASNADIRAKHKFGAGPELTKVWEEIKAGKNDPKKGVAQKVKDELVHAEAHPVLSEYVNALNGSEGSNDNTLIQARNQILEALELLIPTMESVEV